MSQHKVINYPTNESPGTSCARIWICPRILLLQLLLLLIPLLLLLLKLSLPLRNSKPKLRNARLELQWKARQLHPLGDIPGSLLPHPCPGGSLLPKLGIPRTFPHLLIPNGSGHSCPWGEQREQAGRAPWHPLGSNQVLPAHGSFSFHGISSGVPRMPKGKPMSSRTLAPILGKLRLECVSNQDLKATDPI